MKDRLLKLITRMGLTATRFADEIGVQRSGISHILSGRNQPSYDFLLKIMSRYPEISLDWLILGKGDMMATLKQDNAPAKPDLFTKILKNEDLGTNNAPTKDETAGTDKNTKVTNVTSTESIVFFYADGTYTTYFPR